MSRIKIKDLPKDHKVSRAEMRKVMGGYTDKQIMLGDGFLQDDHFGGDSGSSSSGSDNTDSSYVFPDFYIVPPGPIPIPYPNIGSKK